MPTLRYGDVVNSSLPEEVPQSLDDRIKERRASMEEESQSSDEQTDSETQQD